MWVVHNVDDIAPHHSTNSRLGNQLLSTLLDGNAVPLHQAVGKASQAPGVAWVAGPVTTSLKSFAEVLSVPGCRINRAGSYEERFRQEAGHRDANVPVLLGLTGPADQEVLSARGLD